MADFNNYRKRIAVLLVCLLAALLFPAPYSILTAQAPLRLLNVSLTNPDEAILYTGVSNLLVLKGEQTGNYLRMERSGGPIEMRAGTAISTRLKYDAEGIDTLRVFNEDKLILEKIYTVKKTGVACACLKNNRDTLVSVEDMMNANTLEVYFAGSSYKPMPVNRGYTATLFSKNGKKLKTIRMEKNTFSDELKLLLKTAEAGTRVVFQNINTLHLPEAQRNISPFSLTIR